MNVRPSHIANIALAFIVFALLSGEAYLLFLKHKFTGTHVATQSTCKQGAQASVLAKDAPRKDVYVNCSGFQG